MIKLYMLEQYQIIALIHIIIIFPIMSYIGYKVYKEEPMNETMKGLIYVMVFMGIWGGMYHSRYLLL